MLRTEYPVSLHEVSKKKRQVIEKVPVHIALYVYQTSKLIFFRFVVDLFDCLVENSYKICYCDTDSILLALVANCLDDLVKPGKEAEWATLKTKWFATETARSQKTPGLLKEEFSTDTGRFIGLRVVRN